MVSRPAAELIVLGDLHGHYDEVDREFLTRRDAALCIFIGDLGDEDPAITRRVSELAVPLLVLLGNHDAWESFHLKRITPALRQCLDALGPRHFAYTTHELDVFGVTLVGCRPFSWGGPSLRSPEIYSELYGISSHEESAAAIVAAARRAQHSDLVIVAHNGPTGLGRKPADIYGKDFGKPGGDWGDRDLELAIRELKESGFRIPLVIAGHMHHRLVHPRGKERRRCVAKDGTVYVNPARVPRIFPGADDELVRHYLSVAMADGKLHAVRELYVKGRTIRSESLWKPVPP
jgi:uncharacterized protein (TIGR04168 family)